MLLSATLNTVSDKIAGITVTRSDNNNERNIDLLRGNQIKNTEILINPNRKYITAFIAHTVIKL